MLYRLPTLRRNKLGLQDKHFREFERDVAQRVIYCRVGGHLRPLRVAVAHPVGPVNEVAIPCCHLNINGLYLKISLFLWSTLISVPPLPIFKTLEPDLIGILLKVCLRDAIDGASQDGHRHKQPFPKGTGAT